MKSVLISIQPKWCELIASGKKTVEVRKTKPKTDVPFKCYIYQTKLRWVYTLLHALGFFAIARRLARGVGKVIGEFVCDSVKMSLVGYDENGCPSYWDILDGSCLTPNELVCYGEWKTLYGWHISDLVIYDKPKELSEFSIIDTKAVKSCSFRLRAYQNPDYNPTGGLIFGGCYCRRKYDWCDNCKTKPITRPPQSWCYVERKEDGKNGI